MEETYQQLKQCVLDGNQPGAVEATKKLIAAGEAPQNILDSALVPAMEEVGDLFQRNEYFIPELLVAARAMEGCMAILQPLLSAGDSKPRGVVVIGTVKGDLHDIGKNIVAAMLKGAGFKIVDLGTDVDAAKFAKAVAEHKPDVIGLSALLTTTMREMKSIIDELGGSGLRGGVKVMVGGAPLTQQFADEIGADAFGQDAAEAVKKAKQLVAV